MLKFLKISALAAAAMAATSAHALLRFGNSDTFGNSSVAFVAVDNGATISLAVDLGVQMASFLNQSGFTNSAGALSGGATALTAQWNLINNTYTVNGVAVAGTYNWTSAVNSFLSNSSVTSTGYQWGIIAGDGVGNIADPASATNVVKSQNILFTVSGTQDFDNSNGSGTNNGAIGQAAGRIDNYFVTNNTTGTHTTGVFGSATATGGVGFLPTTITNSGTGDFGAQFGTNNFLLNPTEVGRFGWANVGSTGAGLYQIGATNSLGSAAAQAATWTWNQSSGLLTYQVAAVPEPGTYVMFLAGLAALGFMARRRAER